MKHSTSLIVLPFTKEASPLGVTGRTWCLCASLRKRTKRLKVAPVHMLSFSVRWVLRDGCNKNHQNQVLRNPYVFLTSTFEKIKTKIHYNYQSQQIRKYYQQKTRSCEHLKMPQPHWLFFFVWNYTLFVRGFFSMTAITAASNAIAKAIQHTSVTVPCSINVS